MKLTDRIGRRMKLHDLHVLTAVVQAGSMSKAAALLNTSQSAISRSIAELEQTMGVKLLDRSAQGVEPTNYGRALLKRSAVAFDELKQGVRDVECLSDPGTGELRIGTSPALSEGLVPSVIEKLSLRYPRAIFHVSTNGALALYEELRSRRIDLGIVQVSGPVPEEDMDQDVLFEEPLVVVAGAENPWVRRRKIKLTELVGESWAWPAAGTFFDSLVAEAFRAGGLEPPRATVYADTFSMRAKLAENGRFLTVVPACIMRFSTQHASLKVLPVKLPTTHRPIAIITLKNRTLNALAQFFIDCVREVAKPMAKGQPSIG